MSPRLAVAFDVLETVFSLEKLRERLAAVGLRGDLLEVWFAQILRDAFALDATGVYCPFREIASAAALASLMADRALQLPQKKSRVSWMASPSLIRIPMLPPRSVD